MKILFDECVPALQRKAFVGHVVVTVSEQGWSGVKNGRLLQLASQYFDAFITVDKNLSFQQCTSDLPMSVIVLHAASNKVQHLLPLVPTTFILLSQKLPKSVFDVEV